MVALETPHYADLLHTLIQRATESATLPPASESDTDTAHLLHLLTVALKRPEHWSEARDLLLHLNPHFERDGRYAEWALFLERAIEQSVVVGDAETRAILQLYLGNVYRIQGRSDAGIQVLLQALQTLEQSPSSVWYARGCNGMARILQEQGHAEQSILYAERALSFLAPDEDSERAFCYRMLGGVAVTQRAWERAYTALAESLRLWRRGNDPRLIAFGLTNLGVPLRGLQRYTEAEAVLYEAIDIFTRIADEPNEAIAHINLASLYLMTERWKVAIQHCHRAERLLLPRHDVFRLAGIYNNWGMAYAGLSDWTRAIRSYEESIRYWSIAENRVGQANAMDNLSVALYATGAFARSVRTCEEALAVLGESQNDSLRSELRFHLAQAQARL